MVHFIVIFILYIYMYTSHPVLLPFLGLENPSDLPNRVAISLQEPRSEPGGAMPKLDSNSNQAETRIGERRNTADQSGRR